MNTTEKNRQVQCRDRRAARPANWKKVAVLFNATRSYSNVALNYPEAFLDATGATVSDGCGRMRCLRWGEELIIEARDNSDRAGGELNEIFDDDGSDRKKPRIKLTLEGDDEVVLGYHESGQKAGFKSRTDRPDYWRDVAQFFIETKKFNLVKQQFPDAFLDSMGNPATDSCAKMRVLRWKNDYNIEKLNGESNAPDGTLSVYGNQMDKTLLAACEDIIQRGAYLDETVVQDLLLQELRRTNTMKVHNSENTFGKVWATRFFKRHNFAVQGDRPLGMGARSDITDKMYSGLENRLTNGTSEGAHLHVEEEDCSENIISPSFPSSSSSCNFSSSNTLTSHVKSFEDRPERWREVAQLFMACGSYKTVKDQFPDHFLTETKQPMSDGAGKMLCQEWKEDLIVEHQEQSRSV